MNKENKHSAHTHQRIIRTAAYTIVQVEGYQLFLRKKIEKNEQKLKRKNLQRKKETIAYSLRSELGKHYYHYYTCLQCTYRAFKRVFPGGRFAFVLCGKLIRPAP